MKMKKILALLMAGAMLTGMLTGCGDAEETSGNGNSQADSEAGQEDSAGGQIDSAIKGEAGEALKKTVEMTLRPLPLSITMRTVRTVTGVRRRLVRRSRRLPA